MTVGPDQQGVLEGFSPDEDPLEQLVKRSDPITLTVGVLNLVASDRAFRTVMGKHTKLSQWTEKYLKYYENLGHTGKVIDISKSPLDQTEYIFQETDPAQEIAPIHGILVPSNLPELLADNPEKQISGIVRSVTIARRKTSAPGVEIHRPGEPVTDDEIDYSAQARVDDFLTAVKRIEKRQPLTEFLYNNLSLTELIG